MRKIDWKPAELYDEPRKIVEKRLQKREREIVMDYQHIRKVQASLNVVANPRGFCVRVQEKRAEKIVRSYLE